MTPGHQKQNSIYIRTRNVSIFSLDEVKLADEKSELAKPCHEPTFESSHTERDTHKTIVAGIGEGSTILRSL